METPKKFILIFRVMSSKITVSSAGGNSMSEITKVALDVMGGDNAPVEIVKVQWMPSIIEKISRSFL